MKAVKAGKRTRDEVISGVNLALTERDWRILYFLAGRGLVELLDLHLQNRGGGFHFVEEGIHVFQHFRNVLAMAGLAGPAALTEEQLAVLKELIESEAGKETSR